MTSLSRTNHACATHSTETQGRTVRGRACVLRRERRREHAEWSAAEDHRRYGLRCVWGFVCAHRDQRGEREIERDAGRGGATRGDRRDRARETLRYSVWTHRVYITIATGMIHMLQGEWYTWLHREASLKLKLWRPTPSDKEEHEQGVCTWIQGCDRRYEHRSGATVGSPTAPWPAPRQGSARPAPDASEA